VLCQRRFRPDDLFMSIGVLVAMLVLGTGFVANGYAGRDRFWLIFGVVFLAFTGLMLGRDGLRSTLIAGPITGSLALVELLVGSYFWAELIGLPRPIAYLSGIGLVNHPLTFNNRLYRIRIPLVEAIRVAQVEPERRAEAFRTIATQVKLERELRPPDGVWGQLRDDIADDDEAWIELIRTDALLERGADHIEAFKPVLARWHDLHEHATEEQRLMSAPALRRRATVIQLATLGGSVLLAGLAVAGGYHLTEVGVARPENWGAIAMLGGSCLLLGRALVVAVKGDVPAPTDPDSAV
jgi:hypothetical protein